MKYFIILLLSVIISIMFIESYAFGLSQEEYTIGDLSWSQASYQIRKNTPTATVQVIDPDMNKISSYIDTLKVLVYSDSYQEGITLTLYETDKNSGIFERTFALSTERSAPNILYTSDGDTITAKYIDTTLPPPYLSSDILEDRESAMVGSTGPPLERVPASLLRVEDLQGDASKIPIILVDQQVKIVADIINEMERVQNFAYLVQILDEENYVVSLSWLTGSLTPMQSFSSAQSWTSQNPGKYYATVFVWESINNPTALSPPLSIEIIVKDAD